MLRVHNFQAKSQCYCHQDWFAPYHCLNLVHYEFHSLSNGKEVVVPWHQRELCYLNYCWNWKVKMCSSFPTFPLWVEEFSCSFSVVSRYLQLCSTFDPRLWWNTCHWCAVEREKKFTMLSKKIQTSWLHTHTEKSASIKTIIAFYQKVNRQKAVFLFI